jgi:cytochrome b pre-mRNA-processing protein 3
MSPLASLPAALKRIFGAERAARRQITDRIYDQIVAAARQPALYASWGVPDTPLGRYEMIALHLFLVLHRLRGEERAAAALAQELTDAFFADLDHSIRELGIGDLGVPKRMKKLARMFYGRAAAYGEAVESGDLARLSQALARNVRPDDAAWAQAGQLADHVLATHRHLSQQSLSAITSGSVVFPAPELI